MNFLSRKYFLCLVCCLSFGLCACSNNSIRINKDLSVWPAKHRWKKAFTTAVTDANTWVPAIGAAVTRIGDIDQNLSQWAANKTPVFGSQSRANNASDNLLVANRVAMWTTAMAIPSPNRPWESRIQRASVQSAGILVTHYNTMFLKESTLRQRPDGTNYHSFPSAHTSGSSAFASLARYNTDMLPISNNARLGLQSLYTSIAVGTAWGRVEANVHYPSDVLVGYALGNFFAQFINNAFLPQDTVNIGVGLPFNNDTPAIQLQKVF